MKAAVKTCNVVLEDMDSLHIEHCKDFRLNDRMYGALTGLTQAQAVEQHGQEQVWPHRL